MTSPEKTRFSHWRHWTALLVLTCLLCLSGLSQFPVIDRDEARFAQASVQMAESGDLINIRFQDEARNKKPAGIYWLQTGAIKAFGATDKRHIWIQRLPSVLGALLAVLMTYWGAARMIGRRGAFIAASMLSLSALMIFEAHIAKTDAILCGLSAACLAALAHLRHNSNPDKTKLASWIFWISLGLSIMIKGPVIPLLVLLTLITLAIWEQRNTWMKQLLNWPAIIMFILIWLPWAITIWIATDGAFFAESLGKDFGGKVISAQEKHSGLPGFYLGTIWITFWPSCLLLIPGFAFAFRAVKNNKISDAPVIKAMRLCLAWILPYWVLVEIMPTKLPHYVLPLFPALAVITAAAAITLISVNEFKVIRRANALIYLIISTAIIGAIMTITTYFEGVNYVFYVIGGLAGLAAIIATFALWRNKMTLGLLSAGLSTIILTLPTYQFILPSISQLRIADQLKTVFEEQNIKLPRHGGPNLVSPDFTEPSLVYHFGTDVDVSGKTDLLDIEALKQGRVIILDDLKEKAGPKLAMIKIQAEDQGLCIKTSRPITGFKYSKGEMVELTVNWSVPCPETVNTTNEKPDE